MNHEEVALAYPDLNERLKIAQELIVKAAFFLHGVEGASTARRELRRAHNELLLARGRRAAKAELEAKS